MHGLRRPISILVYPARREDERWRYLLLRRTTRRGGFWQGVTGSLEDGETPPQAAARELAEETGLPPLRIEPIDYTYTFTIPEQCLADYEPGITRVREHVFLAIVNAKDQPRLSEEHDHHRWCALGDAIALLTYEENIEALRRCDAVLGSQPGG